MVEDVLMGRRAGTKTAAVLCGFATPERLMQAKPDLMLHDVSTLPDAIKKEM